MMNHKILMFQLVSFVTLLTMATSCAVVNAPVVGSGKVSYGSPNSVETVNTNFGSTDLNMVAQSMVDDLIKTGALNKCKTYTLSPMQNQTDQYIDTAAIMQSIKIRLMNSNLVTAQYVVSSANMQNQTDELARQNDTGLYAHPQKMGKMVAAQCRLDGVVSSISKTNADMQDVFYQFDLSLIEVKQGIELWANEKQIRKTMVR